MNNKIDKNNIKNNLNSIINDKNERKSIEEYKKIRAEFVNEYGIDKFNKLKLENYTNVKKSNISYFSRKVEQEKYKYLMPTINFEASHKYIIYRKNDTNSSYTIGAERKDIDKSIAEKAWKNLSNYINNYFKILNNVKDASDLKVKEYFSAEKLNQVLGGNYIVDIHKISNTGKKITISSKSVLTSFYKLLIYIVNQIYPEKFIGIRSEKKCEIVEKYLGIEPKQEYTIVERSFVINKYLRDNIKEFNNYDPYVLFKTICKIIPDLFDKKDDEIQKNMVEDSKTKENKIENNNKNLKYNFPPIKNLTDSLELSDDICERNQIFYGAPGCGKSYKIEKILQKNNVEYVRILFHPEYCYTDFVGQFQPKVVENNNGNTEITYEFIEGPFIKILKAALLEKSEKNYALVIDEINRGNAPAIFGDIFQLLDRKENGESEYSIRNSMISEKIYGKGNEDKDIKLPSNLYIFATMNTSDQNVFTLDTAFKRRWYFEKISNRFSDTDNIETKKLANTKIDQLNITWKEFQEKINSVMAEKLFIYGVDGEDKQLGKYFVTKSDLSDRKKFAYKVLMYLWEDAVKVDRNILFNNYKTLDELIDAFIGETGMDVFKENNGDSM